MSRSRHTDTCLPGRLAHSRFVPGGRDGSHSGSSPAGREIGLAAQQVQVKPRTDPDMHLSGLSVRLIAGSCEAHSREVVKIAITTQDVYCSKCKKAVVSAWIARIHREDGSAGSFTHAASAVAPEVPLAVPQSLDTAIPWTPQIKSHLDWWSDSLNVLKGSDLHPQKHMLLFTDASKEGWGG